MLIYGFPISLIGCECARDSAGYPRGSPGGFLPRRHLAFSHSPSARFPPRFRRAFAGRQQVRAQVRRAQAARVPQLRRRRGAARGRGHRHPEAGAGPGMDVGPVNRDTRGGGWAADAAFGSPPLCSPDHESPCLVGPRRIRLANLVPPGPERRHAVPVRGRAAPGRGAQAHLPSGPGPCPASLCPCFAHWTGVALLRLPPHLATPASLMLSLRLASAFGGPFLEPVAQGGGIQRQSVPVLTGIREEVRREHSQPAFGHSCNPIPLHWTSNPAPSSSPLPFSFSNGGS